MLKTTDTVSVVAGPVFCDIQPSSRVGWSLLEIFSFVCDQSFLVFRFVIS